MNQSTETPTPVKDLPVKGKILPQLQKLSQLPWQIWAIAVILASGTVGFTATSMLLKLPKSAQCTRVFWPIASASTRLYCAQIEADKGTVDGLLQAINLVEALSSDHPLRKDINRHVEEWAVSILDIAEEDFQAGRLDESISVARKIPSHVQVYSVVEKRIEEWRNLWQKGEEIFAQVEEHLRNTQWNEAFRSAVKLLSLENKYWATTKYDETVREIQLAQEESSKLDNAYRILRRGGVDNWLQAITDAQKIAPDSYAHREAQKIIEEAKEKLVSRIETLMDQNSWESVLDVVDRLPETLALGEEINDWKALASAGMEAKMGSVESLEMAIASAQEIDADRPLYQEAQDLISRWQLEIEGVTHLEKARDLAQGGTINDLNGAIASAELVTSDNPRYGEARKDIKDWTRQVQISEDQPLLDQARDLARGGSISSLQEAIAKASLIGPNRALSWDAKQDIQKWRNNIQRQEDQPLFDQAVALANAKDYQAAINAAERIGRGRILYQEARNNIRQWQREIRSQKDLQEAYLIAQRKTPQALASAMDLVRKIPRSTDVSSQSRQALNRWSAQLLSMAEDQARRSLLQEAIKLAKMIPYESGSYNSAQLQIKAWQKILEPPAPPVTNEINEPLLPININVPESN